MERGLPQAAQREVRRHGTGNAGTRPVPEFPYLSTDRFPVFWLLPLIGPVLLRHALRRMALRSVEELERISDAVR